jgi:ectoine hydroxylase-related dioxygenase (phytanoyl-CoA dioxygenase family)
MFYEKIRQGWIEFTESYHSFIKEYIIPNINEHIEIYQTFPSYRIQYPHSKAITTLHHDSDKNHKHPIGEMNILLPITKMFDTNTIWAESYPSANDFSPMETEYGEIIIWNGNRCNHFNKPNQTGKTRISMDFRVLPTQYYNPDYNLNSATTGKKFIIGDYYSVIKK